MPIRALIIVVVAVAALAGCGRRGDLEPPGTTGTTSAAPPINVSPLDPGSEPALPEQNQLQPPPRRRFILDYLL